MTISFKETNAYKELLRAVELFVVRISIFSVGDMRVKQSVFTSYRYAKPILGIIILVCAVIALPVHFFRIIRFQVIK